MAYAIRLRPIVESDLELLIAFATEPEMSLPYEWGGLDSAANVRRRWEEDGYLEKDPRQLAVTLQDDVAVGVMSWRDPLVFGRAGRAWEIGALLAPEHRGKGVGTTAHQLLVQHLFQTTPVHRLCANTEVDNAAEQRVLEKCGFRREGVLRKAGFRGGAWRDVAVYALLRDEVVPGVAST